MQQNRDCCKLGSAVWKSSNTFINQCTMGFMSLFLSDTTVATDNQEIGKIQTRRATNLYMTQCLPVQEVPSPVYPLLHAQVNDPGVLVQAALLSQLWPPATHSSMSAEIEKHSFNTILML